MKNSFTYLFLLLFTFTSAGTFSQPWSEQVSGVSVQLTSASVVSNFFNAWICGYSGTVLRTTNDGTNWQNVSGNGIPNTMQLINICAINPTTAITAGYVGVNTFVYKTTNSGANWIQVFTETNGFINAIKTLSNNTVLMMGDPVGGRWSLWKSTNQGSSWDSTGMYLQQNGSEAGWNNGMWNLSNGMVWFGTNNSRIYYSTNNGGSWTPQSTAPEINSYAIWFPMSGSEGLFGGATLMRTSNYGTNWAQVTALGTGNFGGITGTPLPLSDAAIFEFVWYVRGTNTIYFASNNASNWVAEHTAPAGTYRHISGGIPGGPFWAVRNNGGISFHSRIVGINPVGNEIPESYVLHQNYPNPFNPSTTIRFDLPKSGYVKLVVYNSLGSEVAKLVNENLQAGSYEYKWTVGNLSSGVYFYTLETNDFRDTKKMVIIK